MSDAVRKASLTRPSLSSEENAWSPVYGVACGKENWSSMLGPVIQASLTRPSQLPEGNA